MNLWEHDVYRDDPLKLRDVESILDNRVGEISST